MIIYLVNFINNLQQQKHEVIVGIDTNEANYKPKNRVNTLLHLTTLIDVIGQKHEIRKKPNTHLRGSKRIAFIFCSEHISTFIDKSGITSFNEIRYSDHRGSFIDLLLIFFLNKLYIALPDHSLRLPKSSNTQSVINYKHHLRHYVVTQQIIEQAVDLQKQLSTIPFIPTITKLYIK